MTIYLVRNQSGQFFRAKGYGGSGDSWVDDMKKARLYTKIGPAKSTVTFFSKKYPKFEVPSILVFELDVTQAKVIDMAEETAKKTAAKARREIKEEQEANLREMERLKQQRAEIDRKLASIT